MNSSEWLDGMTPSRDGKWTKLFVHLTKATDVACFIFHEDMNISPVVGEGILNTPREDIEMEEMASEVLNGSLHMEAPPVGGILLARLTWMFGAHVAPSEVEEWGNKPVKDHPESVKAMEILAMIPTEYRKWVVTLEKYGDGVIDIFEDGGGPQKEDRMVEFGSLSKPMEGKKPVRAVPSAGSQTLQ